MWRTQAVYFSSPQQYSHILCSFFSVRKAKEGPPRVGSSDSFADPLGPTWQCDMCSAQCVPLDVWASFSDTTTFEEK